MVLIKADGPAECVARQEGGGGLQRSCRGAETHITEGRKYTPNASIMLILWSVAVVHEL